MSWNDIFTAGPEVGLAIYGMILLMVGAFGGDRMQRPMMAVTTAVLTALALWQLIALTGGIAAQQAFGGMYVDDDFSRLMKALICLGSAVALLLSFGFVQRTDMHKFEYPVIMTYAVVGMMVLASARDLILVYMGLELMSLSSYVLATFRRSSLRSSEAGLKYFVLGALSSGMLLYGMTMIYGFAGATDFASIAAASAEILSGNNDLFLGMSIGLVFLAAGLGFKVSAVPFHMWTPDVYQGAPTPVTAFLAGASKAAGFAMFIRVLFEALGPLEVQWVSILQLLAIASMALGAFAAIAQSSIKRLLAYSSIGHIGFALVGLTAGTQAGIAATITYITIYVLMTGGAFALVLAMKRDDVELDDINELSGLVRQSPGMAFALLVLMVSMAGLPPFLGFWGKFEVFRAAFEAGQVVMVVIGLLLSVVSAFYYLRMIVLAFFADPAEPFDRDIGGNVRFVLMTSALVTAFGLVFVFVMPIIPTFSEAAAAALMTTYR